MESIKRNTSRWKFGAIVFVFNFLFLLQEGLVSAKSKYGRELIVDGVVADPSRYQFFALTASDAYESTDDNVCGAVLIHKDILLTAAHCHGFFNYGVHMYDPSTRKFTRRRRIVEQWRHPNFNLDNSNFNWDLLVMRLEEPVNDIDPAILNEDPSVPSRDEILEAIGFGAAAYGEDLSNVLLSGELQYILPQTCDDSISRFGISGAISGDELLCAGSTEAGNSICLGDSGGPLFTTDGVLVAITSWTIRCMRGQIPAGFARVSAMYNWVQERICQNSSEPPISCPPVTPIDTTQLVEMRLDFRHDSSPEDTTFAVRSRKSKRIEYSGPIYVVPDRESTSFWSSTFYLPEGDYAFEVYDKERNGLSDTELNARLGAWELYAKGSVDSSNAYDLVAAGDHVFFESTTTNFKVVAPVPLPPAQPLMSTRPPSSAPSPSPFPGPDSSPTIVSTAPSDKPFDDATLRPSKPQPTQSTTPNTNLTASAKDELKVQDTGSLGLALSLFLMTLFLAGYLVIKNRSVLSNASAWQSVRNTLLFGPWPTAGNIITSSWFQRTSTIDQEDEIETPPSCRDRKGKSEKDLGDHEGPSMQDTASTCSDADSSGSQSGARLVEKAVAIRAKVKSWCVGAWTEVTEMGFVNASAEVVQTYMTSPASAVQSYLATWHQTTFEDESERREDRNCFSGSPFRTNCQSENHDSVVQTDETDC